MGIVHERTKAELRGFAHDDVIRTALIPEGHVIGKAGAAATSKNAALFPIRDGVAERALGAGIAWWEPWWRTLRDNPALVNLLDDLRNTSELQATSLLRTADIITWMRTRNRSSPG